MPRHGAYNLATDTHVRELVGEYVDVFIRACAANSGRGTNLAGDLLAIQKDYLAGVIGSYLDGKQEPPFNQGNVVRVAAGAGEQVAAIVKSGGIPAIVKAGQGYKILRVWYEGDGKWSLEFRSPTRFRFPAECFAKLEYSPQGNLWGRLARKRGKGVA